MSRGYGRVERSILDAVAKEPGTLIPVLEIAAAVGYDIARPATKQSFRRAANGLGWQGRIGCQEVCDTPVVLCVHSPGPSLPVNATVLRRVSPILAAVRPETPRTAQELESFGRVVAAMIEQGRWRVVDTRTGDPVDALEQWRHDTGRIRQQIHEPIPVHGRHTTRASGR